MAFPQVSAQDGPHVDEKSSPATISTTASLSKPRPPALKMPSGRRVLFFFALVVFFGLACVTAYPPNRQVNAGFEDLLAKVSDASLHELHEYVSGKYKHGVYPEDRPAMQAAHNDDASTTTNLVELVPRQKLNSSSSSAPKQSTSSSGSATESSSSRSVVSSSSPVVSSVSTTTPAISTTSSTPKNSGSNTSTSYTISSTSQEQSASTSTPPSDTTSTTPSEGPSSTSQVVYTTTLQDGQMSTITSVAVVGGGGGGAMGSTNIGSPVSTTGTPSLQNVAARGVRGLGLVEAIVLAAAMSLITL